jgi:hypothetical protein
MGLCSHTSFSRTMKVAPDTAAGTKARGARFAAKFTVPTQDSNLTKNKVRYKPMSNPSWA